MPNLKTEIIAGVTTFFTMAYIMFVHPTMLAETGMDKNALIAVTCIITAVATILTGIIGKAPMAMAPGLGLNSYFTYSLVLGENIKWETALGIVFLSGIFFLLLTMIGIRKKIIESIPKSMINAITVAIGFFIAVVGFKNMGLLVANKATIIGIGEFTPTVLIGLAGLFCVIVLETFHIKGSLLIGIVVASLLSVVFGYSSLPTKIMDMHISISPIAFKLDIPGALKWSFASAIFSMMFVDLFDSIGTLSACLNKLENEKNTLASRMNTLLGLDAFATALGAMLGTSTTTTYMESAAGIEAGGKTGTTAIVTGMLFLLGLFFIPLIGVVPSYATAPALVMVGLYMIKEIKNINFSDITEAFPAFLIILVITLSSSISTGIAFGFIAYTLLILVSGKFKELNLTLLIITVMCILFFVL